MQARTEAEHMRQECHNLKAQLERKQAQLHELQVRALPAGVSTLMDLQQIDT
jgi:heterodisulfide reductase subunit B